MVATTFWHPDGTPMSAQQFVEALYGKLPEFFKDEAQLRALWSLPDTRAKLLEGLAEKGFGHDQLTPLLKLMYHDSLEDAVQELGSAEDVKQAFRGFQKYLYAGAAGGK